MLKFVCIKWANSTVNYYSEVHVNRLYEQLKSSVKEEFSLCCVADTDKGIRSEIDVYPMPQACKRLIDGPGGQFAKLFLFSNTFSEYIKERFVYLDLDIVVAGDLSFLHKLNASLTIMAGPGAKSLRNHFRSVLTKGRLAKNAPVNSSVMVIEPNKNIDLWESFDDQLAKSLANKHRIVGTDQAWIYIKGRQRLKVIGSESGLYKASTVAGLETLPGNAKLVIFPGHWHKKPWHEEIQKEHPWMKNYVGN